MSLLFLFMRFPPIFDASPATVGSGAAWMLWTGAPPDLSH